MQEILLAGGKTGRYFPDSGPGTKVLFAGDKNYGYFGVVSEEEMGLNSEFLRLMSDTYASAKSVGQMKNSWFKFILNERVLFFPRLPLAGNISIADLYAMKVVFDTDEAFKPTTDYTTGQPLYAQNRHISNGTNLFKVRLMDSVSTDYKAASTSSYRPLVDSEVAKLLMALCMPTYPDTLRIRAYAPTDFYVDFGGIVSQEAWVKEVSGSGTFAYNINAGLNQCYYQTTNQRSWRPVLEYIPNTARVDLILMLEDLSVNNQDMPTQVTVSGTVVADLLALTSFTNVADTTAVTPGGISGNLVLQLQPLGAFATPENVAPAFGFNYDGVMFGLYDTSGVNSLVQQGYVTSTDDASVFPYDTAGFTQTDINGYTTAS